MTCRGTPNFCRGASGAQMKETSATETLATLKISHGVLQTEFTTRNTLSPDARILMQLTHGPFRDLKGEWRFEANRRSRLARHLQGGIRVQEPFDRRGLQCRVRDAVRRASSMPSCGARNRSTRGEAMPFEIRIEIVYAEPQHGIVKSFTLTQGSRVARCPGRGRNGPGFFRRRLGEFAGGYFRQADARGSGAQGRRSHRDLPAASAGAEGRAPLARR